MRIAQLAPNVEPVPPAGYGGTELVVGNLTEELVRRGHEVTLFASGDSQTAARLVSTAQRGLRPGKVPVHRWAAYDIITLEKLRDMRDEFDVVHNHMGWQALPWLDDLGVPSLTTNHNVIQSYCESIYLSYSHLPFVAISNTYKQLNFPDKLNYVGTVYNGIDCRPFEIPDGSDGRDYLLFIGRLCEEKGTLPAIQIAQRLNLPIILAGKVDVNDQDYFERKVKPYLNASDVRFIGEVNQNEKVGLYKHAIATVYPVNFEEPFGLVMAESLAAGTPVIALDRGAVREVLTDGETAIVGNSVDELVSRFPQLSSLLPDVCKRRVQSLFSTQRMVDGYEDLYRKAVGGDVESVV